MVSCFSQRVSSNDPFYWCLYFFDLPPSFEHFLSGTMRCSNLIFFSCLSPRISHFSRSPSSFLGKYMHILNWCSSFYLNLVKPTGSYWYLQFSSNTTGFTFCFPSFCFCLTPFSNSEKSGHYSYIFTCLINLPLCNPFPITEAVAPFGVKTPSSHERSAPPC